MTSARDFTRMQFDWLRQVQDDPATSPAAFAVAFVICDHINAKSLMAWPTQETLANAIRADSRTVRRLTSGLSARGHLDIRVQRGRHNPNVYRMTLKNRTDMSAFDGAKEDACVRLSPEKTGHFTHDNRTSVSEKPDTNVLQNCLTNSPKELCSEQAREAGASSSLDENAKAILFGEGLNWLHTATGKSKPALRTAIGQLLKSARDDAGDVLAILRRARREDRADPIAWAFGILRSRQTSAQANGARPAPQIAVGMQLSKPAARA